MGERTEGASRARALASRQKNLITFQQARATGLSRHQIDGFLRRHEWDRLFRGVFAIAPWDPLWHQTTLGACLAAGYGAAASHETAGALLGLDGVASTPRTTHISLPRRLKFSSDRITIHETKRPFRFLRVQGIPTTAPERTLLDLAATLSEGAVELALEDAFRRGLTTPDRMISTLETIGGRGRPGSTLLRRLVRARGDGMPTDSGLETKVWRALTSARLPGLVRQHPVTRLDGAAAKIDLAFPLFKIAIEVESYRWHSGRKAWHRDLARRNDLVALDWTVLHATKEDVDEGCRRLIMAVKKLMGIAVLVEDA